MIIEMVIVHDFSDTVVVVPPPPSGPPVVSWDAVPSADSYQVAIGTAPGLSDVSVTNVGNVLSMTLSLPAGTYYVQVCAVFGVIVGAPSATFTVVV